jgi:peptidoglycan/LPS O-acetylase OafA/YrhL
MADSQFFFEASHGKNQSHYVMNSTAPHTPGQRAYSQLQSRLALPSIPALDGIRAIAVFLVLFYHLGNEQALPFFPGPLGVLGFFVLSGFLITWLLLKEQEKTGSISLKGFYRRRALRIFPAFYVFWMLSVGSRLLWHGAGQVPWSQALSAFFYVSNYFHAIFHPSPDFILHTWSLSAEEQFYLLWPLAFLLLSRRRRFLIGGLSLVIAAIWVHRLHVWMAAHAAYYITYAFDTRADALLVGCLLALVLKERLAQRFLSTLGQPVWAPLVTASLIGLSVFAGRRSEAFELTDGLAIEPLLVAVLICQLVLLSACWPWQWLNSKPATYLGRISYPLYLYHMLATHLATRVAEHFPALGTPFFVALAVLIAIAISACSYEIVEKPFLALKTKTSSKSRKARLSTAPPQGIREETQTSATPVP